MLGGDAIYSPLNRHTLCSHTVERRLVHLDCSLRSIWIVWIHRYNTDRVGRIIVEPIFTRPRLIRVLVEANLSWLDVQQVQHSITNINPKLIARGERIWMEGIDRLLDVLVKLVGSSVSNTSAACGIKLKQDSIGCSCHRHSRILCAKKTR